MKIMDKDKKYMSISTDLYIQLRTRIADLEIQLSQEIDKRIDIENKCKTLEDSNSKLTRIIDAIM